LSRQIAAAVDADLYDSLDVHIAASGDMGKAAVPMGMLLAWCVNMQLVSPGLLQNHERLVLRLRFQEALGSEFLIACGGDLQRQMFNSAGQQFLDGFYPHFMPLFKQLFGEDCYAVRENWDNYQMLAAELTRRYMGNQREQRAPQGLFNKLAGWFKR
jgi:hypothetical protein